MEVWCDDVHKRGEWTGGLVSEQTRKPRETWIYGTTSGIVDHISVTVRSDGAVRFEQPMIKERIETTYQRSKRPKYLNATPAGQDWIRDPNEELKTFERLVAVDTNTKAIDGVSVSVVGVALGYWVWVGSSADFEKCLWRQSAFCIELIDAEKPTEQLGWCMGIDNAVIQSADQKTRTAVIVDSDRENISAYNDRSLPLFRGAKLPECCTLVFATADAGGAEYYANHLLLIADSVAAQVLTGLSAGTIPPNRSIVVDRPFKGIRTITCTPKRT